MNSRCRFRWQPFASWREYVWCDALPGLSQNSYIDVMQTWCDTASSISEFIYWRLTSWKRGVTLPGLSKNVIEYFVDNDTTHKLISLSIHHWKNSRSLIWYITLNLLQCIRANMFIAYTSLRNSSPGVERTCFDTALLDVHYGNVNLKKTVSLY